MSKTNRLAHSLTILAAAGFGVAVLLFGAGTARSTPGPVPAPAVPGNA